MKPNYEEHREHTDIINIDDITSSQEKRNYFSKIDTKTIFEVTISPKIFIFMIRLSTYGLLAAVQRAKHKDIINIESSLPSEWRQPTGISFCYLVVRNANLALRETGNGLNKRKFYMMP